MRSRTAAVAALACATALACAPAALAAPDGARGSTAFTNPGNAAPSVSVSVSPTGEPEAASVGKNGSLWFTFKTGGAWHRTQVAGANAALAGPSLIAGPGGTATIAVEGPSQTLEYFFFIGGHWSHSVVAGKATTYSAPSLAEGPNGPGIAAQGPKHTLWFYSLGSGHWHKHQVGGNNVAFSAPSLVIRSAGQATATRPAGEVDIAVQNNSNSLSYFNSLSGGSWQNDVIGAPGSTFSAPSLIVVGGDPVRQVAQGDAIVAAEGPSHSLLLYIQGPIWGSSSIEGKGWDFSAPSLGQGDNLTWLPVAFQGSGHSMFVHYFNRVQRTSQNDLVAPAATTFSAPSLTIRSAHAPFESDVVVQGQSNSLAYFDAPVPAANQVLHYTGTTIAGTGTTYGG